jgi:hypothetical protein
VTTPATDIIGEYEFRDGHWRLMSGVSDPGPQPPPPSGGTPAAWGATGGGRANAGGVTVPWPTHAAGHIGLLVTITANQPLAVPTGWALAPGMPIGTGTAGAAGAVGLNVWWKRAASNAEPDVTLPDAGAHVLARIITYIGGIDSGNPFDVGGSVANTSVSSTSVAIPGATTTSPNCRIVLLAANAVISATTQYVGLAAADLTEVATRTNTNASFLSGATGGGYLVGDGLKAAAGARGVATATQNTASAQAHASFALLPAVGGGGAGGSSPFRTFLSAGVGYGNYGDLPYPDRVGSFNNGATFISSTVPAVRAGGACIIPRFSNNENLKNADLTFSPALYIQRYKDWLDGVTSVSGGLATLRTAVRDGVVRGLYTLDDFYTTLGDNAFARAVTYDELEAICQFQKTGISVVAGVASNTAYGLPWMPLLARGFNSYLKATASAGDVSTDGPGVVRINGVRQYRFLDAGWGQYRPKTDLAPSAYVTAEVNSGLACGLGMQGGINALDMGKGTDPAWGCNVFHNAKCSSSPAETLAIGRAMFANPVVHGFQAWSYAFAPAYFDNAEIMATYTTLWNESQGRLDGNINQRGDLVAA